MKTKKMYYLLPMVILAIVMGGFIATEPVNTLTMDVNPSIEIVTSRLDRVVEINPLNDDAKDLLKEFKPKDKKLENTVNDLVDLMILTGHIKGGEDNFVMLTVKEDSMDSKFVDKVNKAIAAMLENKQIEATLLNQAIEESEKGENQTGAQVAAQRLLEIDENLTLEELGDMTVRELVYYSQENNIEIESLFKVKAGNVEKTKESKTIITKERAEEIALARINGKVLKVELDDMIDDDGPEYEIEILADNVKHEIEIHAYTGRIKNHEKENVENKENTGKEILVKEVKEAASGRISAEKAKAIALDKAGGGTITDFESDDDEYEIEIKNNGREYEIEIHAYTGQIIKFEIDDDVKQAKESTKTRISAEKAKSIALGKSGGGTITDFDSDDDEYEIEIKNNGREYEIEIHAYTGDIIKFEVEDDD